MVVYTQLGNQAGGESFDTRGGHVTGREGQIVSQVCRL